MRQDYGKVPGRVRVSPFVSFYFLALWVAPVMLHPQCLDFKPPFRPQKELEFCVTYKEFGCCDFEKDQNLMSKYYRIMDNFDYYGYANCAGIVQELLCQVGMHGQRSLFLLVQNVTNHALRWFQQSVQLPRHGLIQNKGTTSCVHQCVTTLKHLNKITWTYSECLFI